MNVSSFSRIRKGSVLNTKHAAPSVARMVKAALLFRFVAVRSTLKVRSLAAKQSRTLFGFRLFGRNATQPRLANLLSGFWRARKLRPLRHFFSMALKQMFSLRQAFKVVYSIVRLITVDMMDLFGRIKRVKPTLGYDSVHQNATATQVQVPIFTLLGHMRAELSENFSAARNGKKVAKESVLDSVYFYAQHAVPSKVAKESLF